MKRVLSWELILTMKVTPVPKILDKTTSKKTPSRKTALMPVGTGITGNGDEIPRLVRHPRNKNPYAPLADNSDGEEAQVNTSHQNSPGDVTGEDTRAHASVASSNSGSADADEQPNWARLTPLPDAGMRQ